MRCRRGCRAWPAACPWPCTWCPPPCLHTAGQPQRTYTTALRRCTLRYAPPCLHMPRGVQHNREVEAVRAQASSLVRSSVPARAMPDHPPQRTSTHIRCQAPRQTRCPPPPPHAPRPAHKERRRCEDVARPPSPHRGARRRDDTTQCERGGAAGRGRGRDAPKPERVGRARPSVWPPDSATISWSLKPMR